MNSLERFDTFDVFVGIGCFMSALGLTKKEKKVGDDYKFKYKPLEITNFFSNMKSNHWT